MSLDGDPPGGRGTLRPTSAARLAVYAIVALALGWLLHPLTDRRGTPPVVTWTQPLLLLLVAAMIGITAWSTWRTVHVHHERLTPAQGVNRLVLARACALVGAVVGGGYLGFGLSWLGSDAELADQRAWRSGAAALAGLLLVVGSLLLERACRIRSDDTEN